MSRILGISGKKQAGKNTAANYIHGLIIQGLGLAKDFSIEEHGELSVLTANSSGDEGWGMFDVTRKDRDYVEYAEYNLWPYVKMYSFADNLKSMCVEFFGLTHDQVYGTDEQKNTETHLLWRDMPFIPESHWVVNAGAARGANMTARDFMQYFGTNVMRQMYGPIWVDHTINRILSERSELAIVPDVRFPNEVEAIQNAGGKVIRLTRNTRKDSHASECGLDPDNFDWNKFDAIIENDGSIPETLKSVDAAYQTIFLS